LDRKARANPRQRVGPCDFNRVSTRHTSRLPRGAAIRAPFASFPHLRGPLRSGKEADIIAEAVRLASGGIKEINLIAQDTTAFGLDRDDPEALPRLLEKLEETPGLEWVRLLYSYPDRITERLLDTMANSRKVVPYLDIPIQHCFAGCPESNGPPAGQSREDHR